LSLLLSQLRFLRAIHEAYPDSPGGPNLNAAAGPDYSTEIKQLMFAKAPIEKGRFDALLAFTTMHQVAWKQVVIEKLGVAYAEAVRKAAPTVRRCDLRVVEHAIPPLWKHLESEMVE
jgi:hypothetical protein